LSYSLTNLGITQRSKSAPACKSPGGVEEESSGIGAGATTDEIPDIYPPFTRNMPALTLRANGTAATSESGTSFKVLLGFNGSLLGPLEKTRYPSRKLYPRWA